MTTETYWNGQPTTCARGTAVVADAPDFPQYWARDLIGQRIRIVRVFYNGDHFDLDDQDGSGWAKVTKGHGGPRWPHKNLTVAPYTFEPDDWGVLLDEHLKRREAADAAQIIRDAVAATCPACGSTSRLVVSPPCSLDRYDSHEWHSVSARAVTR